MVLVVEQFDSNADGSKKKQSVQKRGPQEACSSPKGLRQLYGNPDGVLTLLI